VVDVLWKEIQGFVDAKAASIKDGDQSPVADAGRLAVVTGVEKPTDLGISEDLRWEAAAWLAIACMWHLVARAPRTSNELPRPPDMVQAQRYAFVEKRSSGTSWQ
jgi:hypothetical protein